ncbi:kinase-like protein, partial [Rhizopogon salebrosus TDB-379]
MDDDDLRVEDIEDLPDDLTPFITRTTLDPTSGGAFGDVWKCDYNANVSQHPLVAVKAFKFPVDHDSESIARKIRREIGILKMLRHNNIVALWGRATGFGRRPELDCLVSPWHANILIDRRGHARLIDFGFSAIVGPLLGQSHLAVSSIRPGAIRYAAPELVLSDDAHDLPLEKADIYSFGCVMIQVLSGRLPWSEIQSEYRIPVLISQDRGPQRLDGPPSIIDLDWDFIQKYLRHGPELRPSVEEVLDFVIHRPLDDPPDSFPGASPHYGTLTHPDQSTRATNTIPTLFGARPRMKLNNALQARFGATASNHVRWEVLSTGTAPTHSWKATVY